MAITKQVRDFGIERFLFFSDAVFAISITLLALELKLPDAANLHTNTAVLDALAAHSDQFFGFVLSFVVIASFWASHVHSYRNIKEYDRAFIWLNTLVLLFVAFMPFSTSLLSDASSSIPVVIYALNIAAVGLAMALMWRYAIRHVFIDGVSDSQRSAGYRSMLALSTVFLLSIPIAFIDPNAATYFWLLLIPILRFVR